MIVFLHNIKAMKKEFLHKQVPKSVLSLHFSELICVKMVIFTKFWVEGWLTILSYFLPSF